MPISFQYPLVEIMMALLAAALMYKFQLSIAAAGYFLFCAALLVIIVIDIHHQIIPDIISLPGIALGVLFSFVNPFVTWQSSLIGLLVGGGVLYGIALTYFLLRKIDGLGGGDIKLLAMIGALLGWKGVFFTIFVGSALGTLSGVIMILYTRLLNMKYRIPFGPFLSIAAIVYIFYGQTIISWYFNLY